MYENDLRPLWYKFQTKIRAIRLDSLVLIQHEATIPEAGQVSCSGVNSSLPLQKRVRGIVCWPRQTNSKETKSPNAHHPRRTWSAA